MKNTLEDWKRFSDAERSERIKEIVGSSTAKVNPPADHLAGVSVARAAVSIIVTARNYGHFLGDCLKSCLAQHYQNCEVVYSDDGSTDHSVSIAREMGVKTIAFPTHTGAVAARNRGALASSGDILIFLDGDDQLNPDFAGAKVAALGRDNSFAYGGIQSVGAVTGLQAARDWLGYHQLLEGNFCESASAIWRSVFEAAGGWQETPDSTLWDWHLWLRAARIAPPVKSNSVLLYRVHDKSNSRTVGFARPDGDTSAMLDRIRRQFQFGLDLWKPSEQKPLRVGFVFPGIHMGGATQWLLSLLEHGSAGGTIQWSGVALSRHDKQDQRLSGEIAKRAQIVGDPLVDFPGALSMPSAAAAAQFVAAESDVLVCWCREPLTDLLGDFAGPVVLLSHGSCPWTEDLIRGQQSRATHFAAVSGAAARVFDLPPETPVSVLHNGAETARCKPLQKRAAVRKQWGLNRGEIAVAHVGRFSWDKNPLAVANAVAALGAPYRAVYVGGGWREYDVKEAVKHAVENPIFAPATDQVGDALHAADCFVLATPHEGFSLSLIEAWLAGVPVVATRVGAVPEIEAKFGALVVPVTVRPTGAELAAAVKVALSKRNTARVAKAKRIAAEHFTAEAMGRRWAEWLSEVGGRQS